MDKLGILVKDVPRAFKYPRDPKDEPYVNLAIVGGAKYLVSRDNDLLDLMHAETVDGHAFSQVYPSLTILDPVAFLRATKG